VGIITMQKPGLSLKKDILGAQQPKFAPESLDLMALVGSIENSISICGCQLFMLNFYFTKTKIQKYNKVQI
jgi:hypothetical protein